MTWTIGILSLLLALGFLSPQISYGADEELSGEVAALEEPAKDLKFSDNVKAKYQLSDEQMKSMQDAGIKGPHLAMTAQLAQSSGKSIDDVVKMRTEQKMGWGKIAKEPGVAPKEIGQSVASLHRSEKAEDQMEAKAERKEMHEQHKTDRKDARMERKANRKAKH